MHGNWITVLPVPEFCYVATTQIKARQLYRQNQCQKTQTLSALMVTDAWNLERTAPAVGDTDAAVTYTERKMFV